MTGATLVVRKGNQFAFCSVRHSGYDLTERFIPKLDLAIFDNPKDLCLAYIDWRINDSTPISLYGELNATRRRLVFEFTDNVDTSKPLLDIFEDAQTSAFAAMDEKSPFDDYNCSYTDHTWYVDLDELEAYRKIDRTTLVPRAKAVQSAEVNLDDVEDPMIAVAAARAKRPSVPQLALEGVGEGVATIAVRSNHQRRVDFGQELSTLLQQLPAGTFEQDPSGAIIIGPGGGKALENAVFYLATGPCADLAIDFASEVGGMTTRLVVERGNVVTHAVAVGFV